MASPAAGIRRYTSELFTAIARLPGIAVTAVGAGGDVTLPAGVRRGGGAPTLPSNLGWMCSGLPLAIRRARPDVFHAPAYTAPIGAPVPVVLTIHDVSYARHPEWYPYRRDPLRRAFYRRSARAAERIVTDSSFSRDEIVAAYGLDPSRIDVVPLAPAAVFSRGPALPLPAAVPRRYLLHVGDLHVRRNVAVVTRALARLRAARPGLGGVPLVLAGVSREDAALPSLGAAVGADVVPLGYVDEPTLLALYRRAAVLVYPSRYEGFGLPILEAMASGVPVIASRASCVPEVAGDAAVLVDPDDESAWAAAIESVLEDDVLRGQLTRRGLIRAADFTWHRTAVETCRVYARALGRA